MGVMIDGVYDPQDPGPDTTRDGAFRRAASTIRHWVTPDGPFAPEPGRYHLYAAWNCPWAHRALLARAILGLEEAIGVSYARPRRTGDGWVFDPEGAFADPCLGVSVLWDSATGRIVSNESADIVRMLGAFGSGPDLTPPGLTPDIERWNTLIYRTVNNGVYRAGFARTQEAYDVAVAEVFDTLDRIEDHLGGSDWLAGDRFTEADLRLFPTLARFDVAYHYAFKCNIRRLTDYPRLWAYARRIYHMPGVAGTVDFEIYKRGYFSPSELRNPLGIVPAGPRVDWSL